MKGLNHKSNWLRVVSYEPSKVIKEKPKRDYSNVIFIYFQFPGAAAWSVHLLVAQSAVQYILHWPDELILSQTVGKLIKILFPVYYLLFFAR